MKIPKILFTVLLMLAACHSSLRAEYGPPNIVVLLSDDLSWNMPGFNGGTLVKSPNLDRLAEEGVLLTQFYVQSVCSPTRASLMTGRYPFRTGVEERPHGNDIAGMLTDERTLAQALSEAGYFTAIIGKWHLGEWKKKHLPMQRGFQYQYGHYSALIDYFSHKRDEVLDWHRNEQPLEQEGYSTFLIADEVDRLLQQQDPSTPFFYYVPFNAVHGPMHAPEEYIRKYEPATTHIPAEYLAQFECLDIAVGRILQSLENHGFADNTLVVFFNDNGGGKRIGNPPYRGGKGDYYEGGLRVPCILKWPGEIKSGTRVDEPMHVVDLYPTLINIAGGSPEQKLPVDGMDALETIKQGKPMPRDEIIHCLEVTRDIGRPAPGAIRMDDYKLIGDELYNIREDPFEKTDLSGRFPGKVQNMKARLKELALERRPGEKHVPIPGYPPMVYGEEENESQPNILIFLVDDLGYGDLACYGHPFMITPNLDKLASEGMRFTDCHSGAPICSPARAALLTGRNPYRVGIWNLAGRDTYMQNEEVTIAEILKEKGYQTFFTGKWHMSNINNGQPSPGAQGFDQWMIRESGKFLTHKGDVSYKDGASCSEVVDHSIRLLESRDKDKPFFLEVCIREPHTPLTPPQKYMDLYDNDRVRYLEKSLKYGRVLRPSYLDDNASELARYYYGTITQLDEAFGKLMKILDELGVGDNTMVFFTSDNGCEHPVTHKNSERDRSWGTPGEFRGMKRFLYEGGHRVAGIMRWPRIVQPGSVSDELISAVDLLPTICEITGAETPTVALDGVSILPVLKEYPFSREEPLHWNICFTHAPNMAMRLGKFSLLGYFDPLGEDENLQEWIKSATLESFELYNLEEDIRQEVDLKEKEHEVFILLKTQMVKKFKEIQEDGPTWPDYKSRTRPINEGFQIGIPGAIK